MSNIFEEKKFKIPKLKGLSEKSLEEHLKLYAGYVKNANLALAKIGEYSDDSDPTLGSGEEHAYARSEIQRRFAFEFCGMRNHEYYFTHFEGGKKPLPKESALRSAIEEEWGTFERWFSRFKTVAMTRGAGWAILFFDKKNNRLLNQWVDEQHLGHLADCHIILALDMWEHSFVADYQPSGKKQYVEDFFENLNWKTCEENFLNAQ